MLKVKRICGMILCLLLLAGCSSNEPQTIQTAQPAAVTANYKTVEVTRGTFTQTYTVTGKVNSNIHQYVKCEYDGGILKDKAKIQRGEMVKKGDVLGVITYENSDAELARLELAYEHALESKESGVSSYYQRIASIKGDDRISYLQRMQVEYELGAYKVSADAQCEQALEALEEYKERYTDKEILAPMDGLVYEVGTVRVGDEVTEDTMLFHLVDVNEPCVKVTEYTNSELYTLATLGIEAVASFQNQEYPGVVTATPNVVTSFNTGEEAINESLTVSGDIFPLTDYEFGITFKVLELENMLLLPKEAIREGGYVMVLEDGQQVMRSVILGPTGEGMVCILGGLTEGQQVIVE